MAYIHKGLKRLHSVMAEGAANAWIDDPILGKGLDAQLLPNGHLACMVEGSPFWFVNIVQKETTHALECYCAECGEMQTIILPSTVKIEAGDRGAFQCARHPTAAAAVIVNDHTVCVGCQHCKTEIRFDCTETPLIWTPQ